MYLRMATDEDGVGMQREKIKSAGLTHLFLASNEINANRFLNEV